MPGPVQMRFSWVNWALTLVASGGHPMQAGWPIANLRYPYQPFTPAKTVTIPGGGADTYRDISFDVTGAVPIQLVMLVNVNFSQLTIFLSTDPTFATGVTTLGPVTISVSRWNRRRTFAYAMSSVITARYGVLRISGATTDGAAYYSVGGIWLGPLTALPRDIRWDERPRIIEPHIDTPLIGGGTQRVMTGRPYVEMRAQRLGTVNHATPATGDELASWLDLDDIMGNGRPCAWYFNRGNTSEGFIFRKMNESDWNVNQVVSEDDLILHEVVGP